MLASRKMNGLAQLNNRAKLMDNQVKVNRSQDNRISQMAGRRFLLLDTLRMTSIHRANMAISRAAWSTHRATAKSTIRQTTRTLHMGSKASRSTSNRAKATTSDFACHFPTHCDNDCQRYPGGSGGLMKIHRRLISIVLGVGWWSCFALHWSGKTEWRRVMNAMMHRIWQEFWSTNTSIDPPARTLLFAHAVNGRHSRRYDTLVIWTASKKQWKKVSHHEMDDCS